jgi:hypothetical protein
MLTFWTLIFILLLLDVVGIVASIYYAWLWHNSLMGLLAFLLVLIGCGIVNSIVRVAAKIDKISLDDKDKK